MSDAQELQLFHRDQHVLFHLVLQVLLAHHYLRALLFRPDNKNVPILISIMGCPYLFSIYKPTGAPG